MALLAIDQGNTRTKMGYFHNGHLLHTLAVPTDKQARAADLAKGILALPQLPVGTVIGLCTVVPELLPEWEAMATNLGFPLQRITGLTPTPLHNQYATPETLGPDRLMAAVAAAELAGTPVIPVHLGTASVVDAVSAKDAYLGGMIAPGIDIITTTLTRATSALHDISWGEPTHAIGQTSHDAQKSGIFYLTIGGLRAMIDATASELSPEAPVVLTGGWAQQLSAFLPRVAMVDSHLVLRGIARTLGS